MSILHRRQQVMARQQAPGTIPAWAELLKLDEAEALALARRHGITETERQAALSALNAKRKGAA